MPWVWIPALAALACSGPGEATDAGADVVYGHHSIDAGSFEAEASVKTPLDRLTNHGGGVLAALHVQAIYVGTAGVDAAPNFDSFLTWLLGSTDYWSILAQYGVGYGALNGSTYVDADAFFQPGMVNGGYVDWYVLDQRLRAVIHGQASTGDAGASDDGGDAGATIPPIPSADAYILFLPNGVNVDLGNGTTCGDAGGYHSYDSEEPYAIIPPCGRNGLVIAHEMAEMATDPYPGTGWFSDADLANGGGEIGDICNFGVGVDGHNVTQLWSNKDGDCEPQ